MYNMLKLLTIKFLSFLILSGILFSHCKKEDNDNPDSNEQLNDLFPLKVGNHFFYGYSHKTSYGIADTLVSGKEQWSILSEKFNGNSKVFIIERKLNGRCVVSGGWINGVKIDTTIIISDRIRSFELKCSDSSLISFKIFDDEGVNFNKYQSDSVFIINYQGNTGTPNWKYVFKANKGLSSFSFHHPPNYQYDTSLTLDSLHLVN